MGKVKNTYTVDMPDGTTTVRTSTRTFTHAVVFPAAARRLGSWEIVFCGTPQRAESERRFWSGESGAVFERFPGYRPDARVIAL